MSDNGFEFRPSGSIEFDLGEPEPEPGAGAPPPNAKTGVDDDPLSITFGRAKDSKPSTADGLLAGATIDWLIAFPADARPKTLCDRYPHVANRLAAAWSDPARSAEDVARLAEDPRWGTVGFPALVQGELRRLLSQLPRQD